MHRVYLHPNKFRIIGTSSVFQAIYTSLGSTFDETQHAPSTARLESLTPRPTLPLLDSNRGCAQTIFFLFPDLYRVW